MAATVAESRLCAVPSLPDIVQSTARAVASSELFIHQLSCSLRSSFTGQSKEERLLRHVIFEAAASNNSEGQDPLIKPDDYHTFDVTSINISVNPKRVLSLIDGFGWGKEWLMVVGGSKGVILDSCVHRLLTSGLLSIHFKEPFSQPPVILEMGSYVGYSAIRLGEAVQSRNGKVFSIESDPANAAIAKKMVEIAGLSSVVTIIEGKVCDVIPKLKSEHYVTHVDFCFVDHWKDCYLSDVQLLEGSELLRPGSRVVADNILYPGAPEFLKYMQENPWFESTLHQSHLEFNGLVDDAILESIRREEPGKSLQSDSSDFLRTPEKTKACTPRVTESVPSQEAVATSDTPATESSGGWMDVIKAHVVNVGSTVVSAGSAVTSGIVEAATSVADGTRDAALEAARMSADAKDVAAFNAGLTNQSKGLEWRQTIARDVSEQLLKYSCKSMKLASSENIPTFITSSAIEKMLSYKGKVSKTFVAKTMKIIDKDESGEVDVDEMVAYFLRSAEMASDDKFEEKMKDFRAFITDSLAEN